MRRGMRNGVGERSRAAVAVAGTREKGSPSGSAHRWTDDRRVTPDGSNWRPGKTAAHGRRRS